MAVLSTLTGYEDGDMAMAESKLTREPLSRASKALCLNRWGDGGFLHWTASCRINGESLYDWAAANEPPVPTIALTSPQDVIIAQAAVEEWVAFVKSKQPTRQMELAVLKGTHGQLLFGDKERYTATITNFVRAAVDAAAHKAADEQSGALTSADAALAELLANASLEHLAASLGQLTLTECFDKYDAEGRTGLISHSKSLGVTKLSERQAFATAIGKARKGTA